MFHLSRQVRQIPQEDLGVLVLDEQRNADTTGAAAGPITTDESSLSVWVIPTNEELMIARDTQAIVAAAAKP